MSLTNRIFIFLCLLTSVHGAGLPDLGSILLEESDAHGAAVEFRRQAMDAAEPEDGMAYFGASAYAYLLAGDYERSEQMLDAMEDRAAGSGVVPMLLRGENARLRRNWRNAAFYYGASRRFSESEGNDELVIYSGRRESGSFLRLGDVTSALETAGRLPSCQSPGAVLSLQEYASGRDKRPWLGGLLGMVPGMGYLYSGETANAIRSLILNSIFIFAMVDTAGKNQWGAFAAVTFFEITWYSGSIYGGIDAAHRYNRRRLDDTARAVEGDGKLEMDVSALPRLGLSIVF